MDLPREEDGAIEFWRSKDCLRNEFENSRHWSDEMWKSRTAGSGVNKKKFQHSTDPSGCVREGELDKKMCVCCFGFLRQRPVTTSPATTSQLVHLHGVAGTSPVSGLKKNIVKCEGCRTQACSRNCAQSLLLHEAQWRCNSQVMKQKCVVLIQVQDAGFQDDTHGCDCSCAGHPVSTRRRCESGTISMSRST